MKKATLITPFPPQPTGLADYAKRILSLTENNVEWTVAYPTNAHPVDGYNCVPISGLKESDYNGAVIYQIGNSPHCEEVIQAMLTRGGTGLFHETNMHHVLRNRADRTGHWEPYYEHILHDYGPDSGRIKKIMGRKTKNFTEYDKLLRLNPLVGKLASASQLIAVLSDTARMTMEKLAPGKPVVRMGFLPDFLARADKPDKPNSTLIIGIAGTFHYGRSFEEIVSAVAMLRRTVDCKLLIVGAGWPETNYDWVTVTGRLPDKEFREQLETIDIAIDLRHHTCGETSGSMMDILRSGIPAVVTSQGSFRDLPADSVMRISAESGALGAFAALKFLIDNKEILTSVSRKATEYFAAVSDKKKCLNEWLSLIERSEK